MAGEVAYSEFWISLFCDLLGLANLHPFINCCSPSRCTFKYIKIIYESKLSIRFYEYSVSWILWDETKQKKFSKL